MALRVVRWAVFLSQTLLRELDRLPCNNVLLQRAAMGKRFNDVAVAVSRGEVHKGVNAFGVIVERVFDHAHGLDKDSPVGGAEQTQASNRVANADLIGGLTLGV